MSGARPDAVVVGGGAIGCACAWELALRGMRVVLVERGAPGREATWAAAGMLSALAEGERPDDLLPLARASEERYPAFVSALREAAGLDVEHRTIGKLQVASSDEAAEALRRQVGAGQGARPEAEWLDAAAVRRIEPSLASTVRGAALSLRDAHVDNRRLGRALWAAAERAGVRFRLGIPAARLLRTDAGRVAAVELATGERIEGAVVVVAAGCWSGLLAGLPRPLPVAPVRGQMLAVDAAPRLLARIVMTPRCYLIPAGDGRVLVGATVEHVGFRATVTPAGLRELADAAAAVVPAIADAPVGETWAGLRPGTPDDLPILGADPDAPGLFYATGHFRNGILLAPITAEVVADAVEGRAPAVPIERFSPARFAGRGRG